MIDKTRAEFEEAMKKEVGWGKETLLVIGDRYFYSEAQSAFESWPLAKEKYEPRGCAWSYDEDTDSYDTQCGGKFQTITDSIEDNGIDFCCYCGGEIQDAPSTQGGGE